MNLPFAGGFYRDKSLPISHQEAINCYPNIVQSQGSLNKETLYGTPGITQVATSGAVGEINRGSHVMLGIVYAVNGDTLYSLDRDYVGGVETFSYTTIGTISGAGRVSMADNGAQLMILVPGGSGYIYTAATDTLAEITDADFTANGNPQYVIFIDGYFACSTDSKKWIISALNDGTSYDALDFGSAESDPDNIVSLVRINNQVFVVGSETMEGNQNIGGADFPFQRNNVFLDKGCNAPFTLINTSSAFFMVGGGVNESPAVWMYTSNNFVKVSTTAIDDFLAELSDSEIRNSFAWEYGSGGAYFVGFTFTSTTFVYDMISGLWHERKSKSGDSQSRWRVNSLVKGYGRILVFDSVDGRVGELDINTYSEYDNDITRRFTTMPFFKEGQEIILRLIRLTMESGVGNSTVENPKITMQISRNGKTFSQPRERYIGKEGKYETLIEWKRNGRGERLMCLRFTCTDQVKFVAIKLEGFE